MSQLELPETWEQKLTRLGAELRALKRPDIRMGHAEFRKRAAAYREKRYELMQHIEGNL